MKKAKGLVWILIIGLAGYFGYTYFFPATPVEPTEQTTDSTAVAPIEDTMPVVVAPDTTKKDTAKGK